MTRESDPTSEQVTGPERAPVESLDENDKEEKKEDPQQDAEKTEGEGSEIAGDPFDPANLRLSQDFAADLGVKKALLTVPVRKPGKEPWVRTHPDQDKYWLQTAVVELKEEQEVFLVLPSLWPHLAAEPTFSLRLLVTAITRQGVLFIWPIRLPGQDGRLDNWSASALEAAELAKSQWIRVTANMQLGAYEVRNADANIPEPTWPEQSLNELLKIAFRERLIDDMNHPVLAKLRGEV